MMKLAVISDLHVGLAARAKDLCPVPPSNQKKDRAKYDAKADDTYRQRFVQFIEANHISADYLVLPGDLTHKAQPQEVKIASDFVLQAADVLKVPRTHILFVPGNHDVDWSAFDLADNTGVRWGQRYACLGHEHFCFRKILDQGVGDVLSPPHFIVWTFADLLAIGYNSSSHDTPVNEEAAHHGLAAPQHLAEIRAYINSLGPPDVRVRLFIVHHHALDFANPIPGRSDFSLMTNAEELLSILHDGGFDLIIHGHRHHPRFETHSTMTYPHLPILCSGSFSVEIDTEWAGIIDNQFHLVTITAPCANIPETTPRC